MKRRNVLLGAGASLAAPAIIGGRANAQSASVLGSKLTITGADPTASASGFVPAYTGGLPNPPAGWTMGSPPPKLYAQDMPLFTITPDNVAKYANMLCAGQLKLLTDFGPQGYKINVYPSRRPLALPDYVQKNIILNVTRAQPSSAGYAYGFSNALGGIPFPILSSDPNVAGMQIMLNHETRYQGVYFTLNASQIICSQGQNVTALTETVYEKFSYYAQDVTLSNYDGFYFKSYIEYLQPANQVGGKACSNGSTNIIRQQNTSFEYLVGEGRIREAPAAEYDIPSTETNDANNYDEIYVFLGPLDRYNWKLLGKKEMIVPYNNYDCFQAQPDASTLQKSFFNPDLIRWEVHRCYVVDATLAPGKRHTMPHRVFYVDEDTAVCMMSDGYDALGNYWRFNQLLPSFSYDTDGQRGFYIGQLIYNFQTNQYISLGPWFNAPQPMGNDTYIVAPFPDSILDPDSMSNSGGL